jgi:hypothetical protein
VPRRGMTTTFSAAKVTEDTAKHINITESGIKMTAVFFIFPHT